MGLAIVPLAQAEARRATIAVSPTVFSRSVVMNDIMAMKARAAAKGGDVEVTPETEINVEKKLIDLTFDVTPTNNPAIR